MDTFDRDVCIKGDAEIKAFNLIKTELALLEKAQQSRFYEDWFQDWSTEVYSMKLFLVRHYKSFENSKEVDELIKNVSTFIYVFQDRIVCKKSLYIKSRTK